MDIYIYYRVPVAHTSALHDRIRTLQAALQTRFGLSVGLKRRPGEQDGVQTWMEIYERIAPQHEQAFCAALEQAMEEAGIAILIAGSRHVERFEDIASCA